MPPTLILIRHAQALHNVEKDYEIPDPDLTELGRGQCQTLSEHLKANLPGTLDPDLIVVSPMRRCVQTALLSLDFLISGKNVPIVANAGWQENSDKPCDTGSPIEALAEEFPTVDFSEVDPVYPDKTSPAGRHYAHNRRALLRRGQTSLAELYARTEKVIVVVSHSGFLRAAVTGFWFMNADYRIFDFAERAAPAASDDNAEYRLVQWESTRTGGLGTSWLDPVVIGEGLPEEKEDGIPKEDTKLPSS